MITAFHQSVNCSLKNNNSLNIITSHHRHHHLRQLHHRPSSICKAAMSSQGEEQQQQQQSQQENSTNNDSSISSNEPAVSESPIIAPAASAASAEFSISSQSGHLPHHSNQAAVAASRTAGSTPPLNAPIVIERKEDIIPFSGGAVTSRYSYSQRGGRRPMTVIPRDELKSLIALAQRDDPPAVSTRRFSSPSIITQLPPSSGSAASGAVGSNVPPPIFIPSASATALSAVPFLRSTVPPRSIGAAPSMFINSSAASVSSNITRPRVIRRQSSAPSLHQPTRPLFHPFNVPNAPRRRINVIVHAPSPQVSPSPPAVPPAAAVAAPSAVTASAEEEDAEDNEDYPNQMND
eukprot:TRINITY_DN77939_c0_g1_i1.p1 TRINITY_DN77939_c0_g1~~TRINITY_DN77939_c0_g1_i1.p1  ORF type:complete len:349 (+),score=65.25 TRINITY_DN77939_c0_g1_i1:121-1167(+)